MKQIYCIYNGQLILDEEIDDLLPEVSKEFWMCRGQGSSMIRLAEIKYPPLYNREGVAFSRDHIRGDALLATIQQVYYPNKLGYGDITTDVQGDTPDAGTKH